MKTTKTMEVIMLPTDDINYAFRFPKEELTGKLGNPQHLYIVSDNPIKEGDWVIIEDNELSRWINKDAIDAYYKGLKEGKKYIKVKKIEVTTDSSLFKDFVGSETSGYGYKVPQIPQSFIEAYVREGSNIKEIEVEVEELYEYRVSGTGDKFKIKTRPDNTVIIHPVEKYSLEKLKEKLFKLLNDHNDCLPDSYSQMNEEELTKWFNDWVKENL